MTLGGTNPTNGVPGKRHPTLLDGVIVGSGAQILGPIVVGSRARIGANAVVTDDVPEGATMVGVKARSTLVAAETWQRDFIPYGTPCKERCEPCEPAEQGVQRLIELEAELAVLKQQVAALSANEVSAEQGDAKPAASRKRSRS